MISIVPTERNRLGMALFILSESVFFVMLILAFIYFRGQTAREASRALDPLTTGLFSIALFASSGTVWRAERSLHRRDVNGVRRWLAATIVLGAIFIFGQGREYLKLIGENVTISRGLFGTTFFTLTGFHGIHVCVGLILLLIVLLIVSLTGEGEKQSRAVGTVAIYWHFVDVVWVFIFSIVYLWTAL